MKLNNKRFNIEYTLLQSAYWVLHAIVFGFTTVFLQYKCFSNSEIGIVFALGNAVGFFLQPLSAGIVDRSGNRLLIRCMRLFPTAGMVLMAVVCLLPSGSPLLMAAYIFLIPGVTAFQPLCTSLSFYVGSWGYSVNFSRARAFGSLAYAVCLVSLGALVSGVGEELVPAAYIVMALLLSLSMLPFARAEKHCASAPAAKAPGRQTEQADGIVNFARRNKRFLLFLLGTTLLFAPHTMIGNFMIEFVRGVGGGSSDLGSILAFMTITEVPVMLLFPRLARHFKCSTLLRFSVIMFTVKELCIYLAPTLPFMYAAEALQALSFAIFIPASVRYVDEVIDKRNAVKGQAFVTTVITLGSIIASYAGGLLLDTQSPSFTLLLGVMMSAAGTAVTLFAIQATRN